ncbi:MAG: tetratricopeptide repeat protein [Planctomycetota bacterium]
MDSRYVNIVQLNAEAFYDNMCREYFTTGWRKPLIIYYHKNKSDTQRLLARHGRNVDVGYGLYIASKPAVYTHRVMDDGGLSGWGTLFHEITHHFIELNYHDPPSWFNEGLSCFIGEQTRIVKSGLDIGHPNPWRERNLRNMIENGLRIDIKYLTSLSSKRFYEWEPGYHLARALFFWLHENNILKTYLQDVWQEGYDLSVLQKATGKSYRQMNTELLSFIKANCYSGAYLQDARQAKNSKEKKDALKKTLEIKPDYKTAQLELASLFYGNKSYARCRERLKPILSDTKSKEHMWALKLAGKTYYKEKDYKKALAYYQRAFENADYCEYGYELAYLIASCHHYLKDYKSAKNWYKKYIDLNWQPEANAKWVAYARKYQEREEMEH